MDKAHFLGGFGAELLAFEQKGQSLFEPEQTRGSHDTTTTRQEA